MVGLIGAVPLRTGNDDSRIVEPKTTQRAPPKGTPRKNVRFGEVETTIASPFSGLATVEEEA